MRKTFQVYFWSSIPQAGGSAEVEVTTCAGSTELVNQFVFCGGSTVHPESFRSNAQNANAFERRNRPRVKRNGAFICVRLRLRSFASTVRDRPRALTCVRTRLCMYIYIYTQLYSGSGGTTAAGRFQPNRILCPRTHRRTASSAPAPVQLRAPCTPSHRSRSARPPLRDSSRQINELRVVRPFVCANCVHVHRYTIERAYARAYINANAVSYVRLRACLRAELIKTQNVFACKIFQHANALWVQKFSGCTIVLVVEKQI